jgi:hypothetical protein
MSTTFSLLLKIKSMEIRQLAVLGELPPHCVYLQRGLRGNHQRRRGRLGDYALRCLTKVITINNTSAGWVGILYSFPYTVSPNNNSVSFEAEVMEEDDIGSPKTGIIVVHG